jgi:FdhE protein
MPYVQIPTISREKVLLLAEARWRRIGEARPDLAPALALQRDLLGRVLDAAAVLDGGRLPKLSLPPKYLAAKLTRGVPAFAGEPIPVPVPVLTPTLLQLCDALAAGGAGAAAEHIKAAITTRTMDPGSLLTTSMHRDQEALRTGAVHRGLSPDLLWLVAELAVSPFVHALQRLIFGGATGELDAALDRWNRGHCPACGSWPAVAEVAAGHRVMRCSFCAAAWELTTYACIYCDESGEKFVTAAPDEERKDRRLEVCSTCGGYLKTIDLPELSPFPLLSISDIETTDLDVAAMEHGYARPQLKDLRARRAEG